jgi:hypothetical protein
MRLVPEVCSGVRQPGVDRYRDLSMRQHAADASACRPRLKRTLRQSPPSVRESKGHQPERTRGSLQPQPRLAPSCARPPPSHQRTRPSLLGAYRVAGRIHGECPPGLAANVKPGHAASAARPWPSVENPAVTPTVSMEGLPSPNCDAGSSAAGVLLSGASRNLRT